MGAPACAGGLVFMRAIGAGVASLWWEFTGDNTCGGEGTTGVCAHGGITFAFYGYAVGWLCYGL